MLVSLGYTNHDSQVLRPHGMRELAPVRRARLSARWTSTTTGVLFSCFAELSVRALINSFRVTLILLQNVPTILRCVCAAQRRRYAPSPDDERIR